MIVFPNVRCAYEFLFTKESNMNVCSVLSCQSILISQARIVEPRQQNWKVGSVIRNDIERKFSYRLSRWVTLLFVSSFTTFKMKSGLNLFVFNISRSIRSRISDNGFGGDGQRHTSTSTNRSL